MAQKKTKPTVTPPSSSAKPAAAPLPDLMAAPKAAQRRYRLWQIGLASLAFLLYANTLGHQFAFDDSIVITGNAFTKQGIAGMHELFTKDFFEGIYGPQGMELTGGRYRPLSLLMFALEWQFFPNNPAVGHFLNVLFFALTAFLLLSVLTRWFGRESIVPYAVTLLFVVHPVHTEVVANIKSRDEILCLFLLLTALYSLHQKALKWTILGTVAFFGSMLAKETAFMFVPLLPLIAIVFYNEDKDSVAKAFGAAMLKSAPYIVAAVLYYALRYAMVGGVGGSETNPDIMENPFVNSPMAEKLGTIGVILLRYMGLMFFPHPLSCDYSYPQIPYVGLGNPLSLLAWALFAGATGWSVWKVWQKNTIALAWLMFVTPLLLVSNLPFNIGAPMGERFLYVPSWGLLLALVLVLNHFLAERKTILWAVFASVAVLMSVKTITRNPVWYDNLTLFAEDVNNSPNSAKIHYYYANSLLNRSIETNDKTLLDTAIPHFLKAQELNPKFHHAYYDLANLYDQKGDGKNALINCQKVLELQPQHLNSTLLMGKIYGRYMNDADKAIEYLERYVITYKQDSNPTGWQYLGTAYAIKGRLPEAIAALNRCIKLQPDNADAYTNLGYLYLQSGQAEQGNAFLEKAKQLKKR